MPSPPPLLPLSHVPLPPPPPPPPASSSSQLPSAPPRSAKSLGKQRAPPLPSHPSPPPPPPPAPDRHITIRFTDNGSSSNSNSDSNSSDLTLYISPSETISTLKRQIRSFRPSLEKRRLRLIHSGRVMGPGGGVRVGGWLDKRGGKKGGGGGKEGGKEGGEKEGEEETTWIHCSVGLEESQEGVESGEEDEPGETAQIVPLRGFDTLRSTAGLSEQDVAAMRRQFHGLTEEEEEVDESARNLIEEQWIDGVVGNGELGTDLLPTETYSTILQGSLTGFFFPFLPLFFFKESEQHSFIAPGVLELGGLGVGGAGAGGGTGVVFSRRMQVSLTLGLGLNAGFGFLRWLG